MTDKLTVKENIPLTVVLSDGTKTISKEVLKLVEGTAFSAMDVLVEILGKNKIFFIDFNEMANYSNEQVEKILGINEQEIVLEKEVTA
ncbi:MAG: hypothetical protein Q8K30_00995 [Candidatus Gracilibacteria bacterium]|nr:hypothetical protein [Candidatus Gracilibacteria bacterium]